MAPSVGPQDYNIYASGDVIASVTSVTQNKRRRTHRLNLSHTPQATEAQLTYSIISLFIYLFVYLFIHLFMMLFGFSNKTLHPISYDQFSD